MSDIIINNGHLGEEGLRLLGPDGHPVELAQRPARNTKKEKPPPMGEQGAFGTHEVTSMEGMLFQISSDGGISSRRPTVLDLENMLLQDSQAGGLEVVVTMPIRSSTGRIEAHPDDNGEAEFAREILLNPPEEGGMKTPINQVIAQMCGAFARRQAFFEIVWGERDGKKVIDKLAFRRASTCQAIDFDGKLGYRQEGYDKSGEYFDRTFLPNKAVVYIHGASSTSPLSGLSAFEAAYQDYLNKRKLKLLYFMYLQKFGIPPIIATTDDPTKEGQEALLKKAEAIRAGAVIAKGMNEAFETLNAAQTVGGAQGGSADFREAFRYLDQQMAISMLVQFLMLGTQSSQGSWALSRDHSDLFLMTEESRQHEIEDAITHQAVANLIFQNFGPDAAFPKFKLTALSQEHEAKATDFMKALLSTGGAPPINAAISMLVLKKALANMDINEDQIQSALEEAQNMVNAMGSEAGQEAGGPGGGILAAVRSIQSAPSTQNSPTGGRTTAQMSATLANAEAKAEANADLDDEVLFFASSPNQVRGPDGKWYPAGPGSGGGKGGAIGSRSGIHIGGGGRRADTRPRTARQPAQGPHPATPEGQKKPKLGRIGLPSGEVVDLADKPLPQGHYTLVGRRSGAAFAVFFPDIVQGRQITAEEIASISQQASGAFDSGIADLVGRFDGQNLLLSKLNNPPEAEIQAEIGLLGQLYGPRAQSMTLAGQQIASPASATVQNPTTSPAKA